MSDEALKQELERDIAFCTMWARRNYWWAHAVFGVSVLASFLSTVLVAGNLDALFSPPLDRIIAGTLTALPAVMLLVNNTLRFEERAKWFWRKTRAAERYLRRLRDRDDPNRSQLGQEYSELAESMENEWPAFGSSPTQPKKDG